MCLIYNLRFCCISWLCLKDKFLLKLLFKCYSTVKRKDLEKLGADLTEYIQTAGSYEDLSHV
jgi:hypothetical protein